MLRVKSYPHNVFSKVQTCTRISLVSSMLRMVLIHVMIAMTSRMLPMTLCVRMIVVVHVKVVSVVSDHKMPTFSLPTLRAAQGNAFDWPVPVYPGIRHVLLVKMVKRPIDVKLRMHALTTYKNVFSVERVWWGVPNYVKSVQIVVLRTLKINLLMTVEVSSTM